MFRKSFLGIPGGDKNDILEDDKNETALNKTDPEDETESESVSQESENIRKDEDQSVISKSEAWENNSETPDITIEINDSTATIEESSVTEADETNKANMTIDEFLEETETIANDLMEDDEDQMLTNLITRATVQSWENVDLGNSNLPPPLLLQENLRYENMIYKY